MSQKQNYELKLKHKKQAPRLGKNCTYYAVYRFVKNK